MLEGREAHHLIHVLRAAAGTSVELIDGRGRLWSARVGEISGNRVRLVEVSLLSEAVEPEVRLTLVQALCKSDRLTWILQKATELEVSEIHLVQGRRSVVRISQDRSRAKLERWRTILANAAKQCRRSTIPALYPPLECREVCEAVGIRSETSPSGVSPGRSPQATAPRQVLAVSRLCRWSRRRMDRRRMRNLPAKRFSSGPIGAQHPANRNRCHGCGGPFAVRTVSGKLIASV